MNSVVIIVTYPGDLRLSSITIFFPLSICFRSIVLTQLASRPSHSKALSVCVTCKSMISPEDADMTRWLHTHRIRNYGFESTI